jgi:hypothetical protein
MSGYVADTEATTNGEILLSRILPLTHIFLKEPMYGNGSILFKELRHTLTDFLIVSSPDGSAGSVYRNATPVAQECVMSWCVKRLTSRYAAGEYEEEVTKTFFNTTTGPWPWITTPFGDENDNGTDMFYLQEIGINVEAIHREGRTSTFGALNHTHSAIAAGFADIFPSSSTAVNESAIPLLRYRTWTRNFSYNRQLDFNPWLAPNNFSRHMERWAVAMTNVIRTAPSKEMLAGHSFTRETFVSIRWAWLTFPFALLLFSLVFLISTIIKTSKDRDIGVWKTSAMPTLIHSLPPDVQKAMQMSSKDYHVPKKDTKQVRIRLHPERGWRVSGQLCVSPTLMRRTEHHGSTGWI